MIRKHHIAPYGHASIVCQFKNEEGGGRDGSAVKNLAALEEEQV